MANDLHLDQTMTMARGVRHLQKGRPGRTARFWATRYACVYICIIIQIHPFQTPADPTRRRAVEALREGERQVDDIVRLAGVHQSGVSRHLRIL